HRDLHSFPYTTLFRSGRLARAAIRQQARPIPHAAGDIEYAPRLQMRGGELVPRQMQLQRLLSLAGFDLIRNQALERVAVGLQGRSEEHTSELQSRFDL